MSTNPPLDPDEDDDDDDDPDPSNPTLPLKELCPILEQLGVATVTIEYNGYGDEGNVETILFEPTPPELPEGLEESLENAVLELLLPGWEINEGSSGQFVLDVTARRLRQRHQWQEVASEDTEFQL